MDETSKWFNNFVLVLKANGKVLLHLDLARLNKALNRLVHRGPTLNDIILRLAGVKYLTCISTSSCYHNLTLDEVIILNNIFLSVGRNSYVQLPFGVAPVHDMFQKKIDELFRNMPNVFSIADYILIAGFDEQDRDHDVTLDKVLRV